MRKNEVLKVTYKVAVEANPYVQSADILVNLEQGEGTYQVGTYQSYISGTGWVEAWQWGSIVVWEKNVQEGEPQFSFYFCPRQPNAGDNPIQKGSFRFRAFPLKSNTEYGVSFYNTDPNVNNWQELYSFKTLPLNTSGAQRENYDEEMSEEDKNKNANYFIRKAMCKRISPQALASVLAVMDAVSDLNPCYFFTTPYFEPNPQPGVISKWGRNGFYYPITVLSILVENNHVEMTNPLAYRSITGRTSAGNASFDTWEYLNDNEPEYKDTRCSGLIPYYPRSDTFSGIIATGTPLNSQKGFMTIETMYDLFFSRRMASEYWDDSAYNMEFSRFLRSKKKPEELALIYYKSLWSRMYECFPDREILIRLKAKDWYTYVKHKKHCHEMPLWEYLRYTV